MQDILVGRHRIAYSTQAEWLRDNVLFRIVDEETGEKLIFRVDEEDVSYRQVIDDPKAFHKKVLASGLWDQHKLVPGRGSSIPILNWSSDE